MTQHEFVNGLRILLNLDFPDLRDGGVLIMNQDWLEFRVNPWRWFIRADDARAAKLWALMLQRMKGTLS